MLSFVSIRSKKRRSDWVTECSDLEVIAVEVVGTLVLLNVIVDEGLKRVLLHLQGVNILVSDAVGFSLDALTERQVFDV